MLRVFTTISCGVIFLLMASFSVSAQEKKKVPMASSASVDFKPLDNLKGKRKIRIRIVLEGTDGKSFALTLPFNNQAGIAGVAGDAFGFYWNEAKWNITHTNDRLTFYSYTNDKNQPIPIKSIVVTSEGTLPTAFLPIVSASEGVKVKREGNIAAEVTPAKSI